MQRLVLAALLVALAAPVTAQTPDFVWQYHRSIGETPLETELYLMQGVPETDDIRVQGQCHIGANWIYASLLLAYDVSALKDGDNVEVVYVGPGYRQSHDARVIKQEDGIGAWGIEIVLALDDPVWQVLRRADAMTYQVPGGEEMTLDLAGSFVPVSRFVADCARIGDL